MKKDASTPEISKELIIKKRDELLKELGQIDGEVMLHFGKKSGDAERMPWFSDWHDSFNNGSTWYDSWGKAGDIKVGTKS
jgi:hypothetical protein